MTQVCDRSSMVEQSIPIDDGGSIPTRPLQLLIRPVTLRAANDFIQLHHRHNGRTARDGGKFAVSSWLGVDIVGVAIVGNPLSATYMDKTKYGYIAEVLRTCTNSEAPKGCVSFLYAACTRICKHMGFDRLISYTLTTESGSSLRGAGWKNTAITKGVAPGWRKNDHLSETREYQTVMGLQKNRWECVLRELQ